MTIYSNARHVLDRWSFVNLRSSSPNSKVAALMTTCSLPATWPKTPSRACAITPRSAPRAQRTVITPSRGGGLRHLQQPASSGGYLRFDTSTWWSTSKQISRQHHPPLPQPRRVDHVSANIATAKYVVSARRTHFSYPHFLPPGWRIADVGRLADAIFPFVNKRCHFRDTSKLF